MPDSLKSLIQQARTYCLDRMERAVAFCLEPATPLTRIAKGILLFLAILGAIWIINSWNDPHPNCEDMKEIARQLEGIRNQCDSCKVQYGLMDLSRLVEDCSCVEPED
jgi:hypothetical protein